MILDLSYLGRSGTRSVPGGMALSFAPNLARPKVYWDGELRQPLRFREAISALHDVVVGDLRFRRKDKTAYLQWKAEQQRQEAELRRFFVDQAKQQELARISKEPVPPGLEKEFRKMHDLYWRARRQWASELSRNDPEMFRHLVPCDPVVTVAEDAVLFECFSKDESSYGCLLVGRDAFRGETELGLGTTNVDYSLALYEHFQTLRSYRSTRLLVDPRGFEVAVEGRDDYREEKIDLPSSWLRGFGQIQAAMALPARRVRLGVEAVYSLLAYLYRHREKTGPRSIRFQLTPGAPATLVLDPWQVVIPGRGPVYEGEKAEEIKVWGRRRLSVLARVLPLAERIEVALLGSGLPSLWIVDMGEMRLVLALSGWTTNDWTSSAALDLLTASYQPDARALAEASRHLEANRKASLAELLQATGAPREALLGSLHLLARQGQAICDPTENVYRWRQVMPVALSEAVIGPEHPELLNGRRIEREGKLSIEREELLPNARRLVVAKAENTACEGILDADLQYAKAKCSCGYFFKNRLRGGPCRHLLAMQLSLRKAAEPPPLLRSAGRFH
jgi:hypothetical protein